MISLSLQIPSRFDRAQQPGHQLLSVPESGCWCCGPISLSPARLLSADRLVWAADPLADGDAGLAVQKGRYGCDTKGYQKVR